MGNSCWLAGTLATHPRGRRLGDLLQAQPCDSPPEGHGACLLMGSDFQNATADQSSWCDWTTVAGRALLLVPPYNVAACTVPTTWAIDALEHTPNAIDDPLLAALAGEVRYCIIGHLQVPTVPGGTAADGTWHTGYYRQHPHAGILAITTLPVWSLSVIPVKEEFIAWIDHLYALAGSPVEEQELTPEPLRLGADHYTILLHLLQQDSEDDAAALAALAHSTLFSLSAKRAEQCYAELLQHELVRAGQLTEQGRQCLFTSPYRLYASALERRTP